MFFRLDLTKLARYHKGMRYGKDTEWLRPYIEASGPVVNLKKLKAIKSFSVPHSKVDRSEGLCHYEDGKYIIALNLSPQKFMAGALKGMFWKLMAPVPKPLFQVLEDLSHEMAHMVDMKHSPRWAYAQADLFQRYIGIATLHIGVKDFEQRWDKVKHLHET